MMYARRPRAVLLLLLCLLAVASLLQWRTIPYRAQRWLGLESSGFERAPASVLQAAREISVYRKPLPITNGQRRSTHIIQSNSNARADGVTDMEHFIGAVTLVVKHMSAYRKEHMSKLHASIRRWFPQVHVIVGDDTYDDTTPPPSWASHPQTTLVALPNDCGLALGRNILVQMTKTRYVVILEDDFVFTRTTELQVMFTTLENNPTVAVVGGGLEDKKTVGTFQSYGKDINVNNGGDVFFTPSTVPFQGACRRVDIVYNFFMARTEKLRAYPWNHKLKVGEHEAFFMQLWLQNQVVLECTNAKVFHNTTRSTSYKRTSHRYYMHEYARHVCSQFHYLATVR